MTDGVAAVVLDRAHRALASAPLNIMVVLAVSFLAACGSMNVQVDVIDPSYVETVAQRAQLQSQLREAFRLPEERDAKYRRVLASLRDSLTEEVEASRRQGATSAAEALDTSIPLILGELEQLQANLNALDQRIRQEVAGQTVGAAGADVTAPQLSGLLLQRQATSEAAVEDVLQLLDEMAAVSRGESLGEPTRLVDPTGRSVPDAATRSQIEADLKSITGGFTLTESAHAYAIASAPEGRWAPQYNRTFGRGTFGNLNFAVKMVDLADFTIKGVTFDPSKVAQIASKVTTQSLLLAAQIAGAPVSGLSLGPTDPGSALATQSAALTPVLEANERFAAQEQLRQDAITAILTRIAEEANNLGGNAAQQGEAQRAILATYNAYKDLLQYPSQ